MSKVIRPLVAFKKANPEIYLRFWNLITATSKKAQENEFYFIYAYNYLGVETVKEILDPDQIKLIEYTKEKNLTEDEIQKKIQDIKRATYHLTKYEFNSFFFNTKEEYTNIGTVSEIGRLLLYGWYYDIESWSKEIGGYIYKAYKKIESRGEAFNDLDFKEAVKHIRENIGYYYQNEPELKLYILKTFFNDKLQELLPEKPKELKTYERAVEFFKEIRKNQKAKGIDYWIRKADNLELYNIYLQDILEEIGVVNYLSFEDWEKERNQENEEYYNELNNLYKEYKKSILNDINRLNLE